MTMSWSAWVGLGWEEPDLSLDKRYNTGRQGEPYPESHLTCQHGDQTLIREGYMQCNDCGATGPDDGT